MQKSDAESRPTDANAKRFKNTPMKKKKKNTKGCRLKICFNREMLVSGVRKRQGKTRSYFFLTLVKSHSFLPQRS